MSDNTSNLRLDFGNLPLVEAAVRASLSESVPLTYSVVNAIAQCLGKSFPTLTEPKQIELAPGAGPSTVEFGPSYLPGAVYGGHDAGLFVSVHPQVIVSRWTKEFRPPERDYPRYPSLRDGLWTAVEAFRSALGDEFPGISVVNMSYVNFLPSSEPATILKDYFSTKVHLQEMANAKQVHKLEASWEKQDGVDVRLALEQATAKFEDDVKEGYRLTTAAGIHLSDSLDAEAGLNTVHQLLQTFFVDIISEKAKTEWQLQEISNG